MNAGIAAQRAPVERWFWWLFAVGQAALLLVPLSAAWKLSADAGHGWAVPMLIAYLYWERWDGRPRATSTRARFPFWAWPALVLAALLALILRLFLEPFPLWPAALALFVLLWTAMAATAAWLAGGRAWMLWIARPLIVLPAGLLWPGFVQRVLINPIRESLAQMAAELLNLAGNPAIAEGTSLKLGAGWIGVDEACGGIRSLQAAVMIALFAGELARLSWPRRGLLLLISVVTALLGNMARTLFLAWQAVAGEQAVHQMHDPAGWISIALTLAGVGALAWWWARPQPKPDPVSLPNAVSPRAIQTVLWSAAWLIALLSAEAVTRGWYASGADFRSGLPQWTVHLPSSQPGFERQPLAESAREMLLPDHFESATWRDEQGQPLSAFYIQWVKGQTARSVPFLHNPTVCLPLAGCELRGALPALAVPVGELSLPFAGYLFRRGGQDFKVYFTVWDTGGAVPLNASSDGWWRRQVADVLDARRDLPAQVFTLAVYGELSEKQIRQTLASLLLRKN